MEQSFERAVELFDKAAGRMHPGSCHFLGLAYRDGRAIEKDLSLAVYWFEHAATLGVPESMVALSHMKLSGRGCDKDVRGATALLEEAVKLDHAPARRELAKILTRGVEAPLDLTRAFELLGTAAEKGDVEASFLYGRAIHKGRGVPACPAEAITWYIEAGVKGHLEAQFRAALFYESGCGEVSEVAGKFYGPDEEPAGDSAVRQLLEILQGASNEPKSPSLGLAAYWYRRAGFKGHVMAQAAYERLTSAGVIACVDRFGGLPTDVSPSGASTKLDN